MMHRIMPALLLLFLLNGCWNREKDNPFEPEGTFPIGIDVSGYNGYVAITWGDPPVTGHSGFNIFRSETGSAGSFILHAGQIAPQMRSYTDTRVTNQRKYFYYLTLTGADVESRPSRIVSAVPGPGFHWVVDNWDYLISRLNYDCSRSTRIYYTNYSPHGMIIGPDQLGLVLYTHLGLIESFDMETATALDQSAVITHPYRGCYDDVNQCGWVIDTSGVLYQVDFSPLQVTPAQAELRFPVRLSVTGSGLLAVVDRELQAVLFISADGTVVSRIDDINGTPLSEPVGFADDPISRRLWLVDRKPDGDHVFSKGYDDNDYSEIDSFPRITDIETIPGSERVWVLDYRGINSSVVQLSAAGIRQITLSGFAYPLDIEVNRYDGTLLVANSGTGEVYHYTGDAEVLGSNNRLNLPVEIITE